VSTDSRIAKPSDFARLLWGDHPPGAIQVWELRSKHSYYLRHPNGVDFYADGQTDVYTAVGLAHKPLGRRARAKADQVIGIAGLWLDIDIDGPGRKDKGVPNHVSAMALAYAVQPPSIVVDSGYGVHAWWLLEAPWRFASRDEQAAGAQASAQWYALHRRFCVERGWGLGSTHDLARLLRLPGTYNGKRGGRRPVQVVDFDGRRYPRERLLSLAASAGRVDVRPAPARGAGSSAPQGSDSDVPVVDRLRALIENLPEFADTWRCQRADTQRWKDTTMSEYNLALASFLVAADWTDTDVKAAITLHRLRHDPGDRKADRTDYLDRTVARAREISDRDAAADALRALAEAGRVAA
jgi:hypothetical protein